MGDIGGKRGDLELAVRGKIFLPPETAAEPVQSDRFTGSAGCGHGHRHAVRIDERVLPLFITALLHPECQCQIRISPGGRIFGVLGDGHIIGDAALPGGDDFPAGQHGGGITEFSVTRNVGAADHHATWRIGGINLLHLFPGGGIGHGGSSDKYPSQKHVRKFF